MCNNGVSALMTHSQKRIEDGIVFLQRRPLNSMSPACISLIGKLPDDAMICSYITTTELVTSHRH